MGGATSEDKSNAQALQFQSTLPVGGATGSRVATRNSVQFQSTLPVGGATSSGEIDVADKRISIHAPRGGSDERVGDFDAPGLDFNPRSPWGERPLPFLNTPFNMYISIHAPRGGSDGMTSQQIYNRLNFNPRSPWGERLRHHQNQKNLLTFQSTLPVGGAT